LPPPRLAPARRRTMRPDTVTSFPPARSPRWPTTK
jgi:hypothetical protein